MFPRAPGRVLRTSALAFLLHGTLFAGTDSFASPKYRALLDSIGLVHRAMRASAAAPKDRRKREAASVAIQKLPPALAALAEEYRSGRLDGRDFPELWRGVERFVGPAAAERYRKFLEKPDARWIPELPDEVTSRKRSSALDRAWRWTERLAALTFLPEPARAEEGAGELAAIASAILMGMAAIIQAKMPEKVARIQADADIRIATINSDTQKFMTTETANTSKYLADQQRDIAIFQSNLAASIASDQQKNVNYRLDRQLAELKDARKDAQAVQETVRNKEWEYNERRLAIAEAQAQKNYELAQDALKAQLTAAGLSSGFANSFDSGNQLTTSSAQTALGGVGGTAQQALTNGATRGAADPPSPTAAGASPLPSTPVTWTLLASASPPAGTAGSASNPASAPPPPSLSLSELRASNAPVRRAGDALPTRSAAARADEKRALDRLLGAVGEETVDDEDRPEERPRRSVKRPRKLAKIVPKTGT